MLEVEVYWNRNSMQERRDELRLDGYQENNAYNTLTHPKNKNHNVLLILQTQFIERIGGMNPDVIFFKLVPDSDELQIAIRRVQIKKGSVFVLGKLKYSYLQENPV